MCGCLCGTQLLLLGWGSAGRCFVWEPVRPAPDQAARGIPRRAVVVGSDVEETSLQARLQSLAWLASTTAARCGRRSLIVDLGAVAAPDGARARGGAVMGVGELAAPSAAGHSRAGGRGIVPLDVQPGPALAPAPQRPSVLRSRRRAGDAGGAGGGAAHAAGRALPLAGAPPPPSVWARERTR